MQSWVEICFLTMYNLNLMLRSPPVNRPLVVSHLPDPEMI